MENVTCLSILTALFGLGGLILDIIGVWKLFSVEPIHIKKIDTAVFNATLGEWSKEEKTAYLVNELNKQISDVNNENNRRSRKAKKYRKYIVWGFSLQFVSVILAFLSTIFK
jgi:hypothetical protein